MEKDVTKLTDFNTVIELLDAEKIIKLYREAYLCDYASDAIYDIDKEFDEVFFDDDRLEIIKLYYLNSNHFDPYEDYFMYNEYTEELKSYSVVELTKLVLSNYRGCLENFYNKDRDKFFSTIIDN